MSSVEKFGQEAEVDILLISGEGALGRDNCAERRAFIAILHVMLKPEADRLQNCLCRNCYIHLRASSIPFALVDMHRRT